ncbi:GNAT family N-acetyltransferase [Acaryochloris marina]|uniref:GNAT family N-acetyltransferase n=1 Tax=Acaryochloris marina TaxID=155978 RepID=UPI0021C389CE|nr:GNAT family N-acetyltransferase [Acaryochloris marina]BDM81346.1 hypothetical protein AM10699_42130 [Acaryochloris marina MBIC10699]
MIKPVHIRSAVLHDAEQLLAIRWNAIMSLADDFGYAATHRWAKSAKPDRATRAITQNSVWVVEVASSVMGWVEVKEDRIMGLYVDSSVFGSGIGSSLMAFAETEIQRTGRSSAHLDASPNAVSFYSRLGYVVLGNPNPDSSIPMVKYFGSDA